MILFITGIVNACKDPNSDRCYFEISVSIDDGDRSDPYFSTNLSGAIYNNTNNTYNGELVLNFTDGFKHSYSESLSNVTIQPHSIFAIDKKISVPTIFSHKNKYLSDDFYVKNISINGQAIEGEYARFDGTIIPFFVFAGISVIFLIIFLCCAKSALKNKQYVLGQEELTDSDVMTNDELVKNINTHNSNMFCPYCNGKIASNATKCKNCGAPVYKNKK